MSLINFKAKLINIGDYTVIRLPKIVSRKLPSRGMVMVDGNINGNKFQSALEPDGVGSHWFKIEKVFMDSVKAKVGDMVEINIEPSKSWPEPKVPSDLKNELNGNPRAQKTWLSITPMARWDWIRWIGSTKNPETRKIRIEKTFSKFNSGIRRPCCFNRTSCTDPTVSNKGILLV